MSTALAAAILCATLGPANVQAALGGRPKTEVVFFASWCAECREHLEKAKAPNAIVVATFDEKDAAEKVVAKLGVKAPCFVDDGLAKELGVKSVPATLVLDAQGKKVTK